MPRVEAKTTLRVAFPDHLNGWEPLYKEHLVRAVLMIGAVLAFLVGVVAVLCSGQPRGHARG